MRRANRFRLYALAAREGVLAWAAPVIRLARRRSVRAPLPQRILFAPQDLRTSDPITADEIASGLFVFAGHAVSVGAASPFVEPPPSRAWSEALFGFGWLRHLGGADTALSRETARRLMRDALARPGSVLDRGPARATRVVARRVISLLCAAPLALTGADHAVYAAYLRAIGRGVAQLEADLTDALPADRLSAAIALSYAALCCSGLEHRLKRATRELSRELSARILPHGGHVSRDGGVLADLLLDLLPLRLLYASRGVDVPDALSAAVERMMPMLRYLRHGSGEMALFHGVGATPFDELATLLTHDETRGRHPVDPWTSGFARIEAGPTLVVADIGAPPPPAFSARAGAGTAAFELSSGRTRLVVNGGTPDAGSPLRLAMRRSAAHSTLTVGGASSATLLPDLRGPASGWLARRLGPILIDRPSPLAERDPSPGLGVSVRHDGFAAAFGVVHHRHLSLSPDGAVLEGRDSLLPVPGRRHVTADIAVRFHIHPDVDLRQDGPHRVTLRAGGETWRFEAPSGEVSVADGAYFGGPERARPALQIVVRPDIDVFHAETALAWRFERVAGEA